MKRELRDYEVDEGERERELSFLRFEINEIEEAELSSGEDEELEFKLRPLTSGELSKLQVIEKKPLQIKVNMRNGKREAVQSNMNDVDINTGEFTEAQSEAMYKAVALSMSVDGEKVTADMVKGMVVGLPELLFTEVINVSRLSDNDLTMVKQFRKNE